MAHRVDILVSLASLVSVASARVVYWGHDNVPTFRTCGKTLLFPVVSGVERAAPISASPAACLAHVYSRAGAPLFGRLGWCAALSRADGRAHAHIRVCTQVQPRVLWPKLGVPRWVGRRRAQPKGQRAVVLPAALRRGANTTLARRTHLLGCQTLSEFQRCFSAHAALVPTRL